MTNGQLEPDLHSIVLNVIGGAVVAIAAYAFGWLTRRCRRWMLKLVVGSDFDPTGQYHIVYGSFMLPVLHDPQGKVITHPYVKTPLPPSSPRRIPINGFSIDNPVSGGEMRACAYLAELFGKARVCAPTLSPDNDLDSRVDVSFISLGSGGSNITTQDTFSHSANQLVTMTPAGFVNPSTTQPVADIRPSPDFDYGVILRICPTQHENRTWIVCAGIGEWGTSSAAWFLANKWSDLFWHVVKTRRKTFAVIVRARRGQDESAEVIWKG